MSRSRLRLQIEGSHVTLDPDDVGLIGRGDDCTIKPEDGRVSRTHARVMLTADGWMLEDLGSTGGTWLAGNRIGQILITDTLEVRLADPNSGPLLMIDIEDLGTGESVQETSLPATNNQPPASLAAPTADGFRQPSGTFSVAHTAQEKIRIGRAPDNDIVVDDLLVSRYHAELQSTAVGFELIDIGSQNGTFVNGQPVQRIVLEEYDLVAIGHGLFRLSGGRLEEYQDTGAVTFEASGLSASLANGHKLLDDISFSLTERSVLAVIGPSGSGKSSLLAALAGLRPANAGHVLYDGRDLYEDYAELQNRIGFVPQDDVLHQDLTVRSTLEYAGRLRFPEDVTDEEAGARIDDLLIELGIAHRNGVPLDQLSGGERKRTNVVSELLTEPSLLFLDEPTSGLDPGISRVLMQKLRELADDGRTIILVTHELANLDLCDQLLVLAPGGVPTYFGPPDRAAERFGREDLSDVFTDLAADPGDRWRIEQQVKTQSIPAVAAGRPAPPEMAQLHRRSWLSQVATLSSRNVAVLAADRRNAALLLLQAPIIGLLLLAALPPGELAPPSLTEVRFVSVAGLVLFVLVLAVSWVGANNSIREIAGEVPILRRERAVGLSFSAYVTSKALVLSGLTIVQSIVIVSLALGRQRGPVSAVLLGWGRGELIVVVTLAGLAAMALGLLISALAGTPERATSLLPMVLILQLLLSAGIMLPEIVDKPVLREASVFSSAHWGVAGAASTTDINNLQIFDDRLRELRTVDSADPGPAVEVLTKEAQPEKRWEHTRRAWLTSLFALLLLTILPLIATTFVLRRYDPGR
jgi:ABC-type multidrug transport system ATPase subunit/pSer/pThr/pTyr-binding forkhead associated (FHA) protein